MFKNVRELGKYISGKIKTLNFNIPALVIQRNDTTPVRERIMSIGSDKRKELKINKSTLWYQQRKIKEGRPVKVYGKTKVRIE